MQICVYAICKNERDFARRWTESMSEADGIYVLDTGSHDGSAETLAALGVTVNRVDISPWRFDKARNASLEMVPHTADICVCTDLDEVFVPGWRKTLEEHWPEGATQARYEYVWSFDKNGREDTVFFGEKIHCRRGYEWRGAVHEVLHKTDGTPRFVTIPGLRLEHYPDKGKSRGQYLPLLELAVKEDPENDRNMHYLGREYFFCRRYTECIATLKKQLSLKSAVWRAERSAGMLYIARSYLALDNPQEAERWLLFACAEEPLAREGWTELARFYLSQGNYPGAYSAALRALEITVRDKNYITRGECWGSLPHDLAAVSAWNMGLYAEALRQGEAALGFEPENPRLAANMEIYGKSCGASPAITQ